MTDLDSGELRPPRIHPLPRLGLFLVAGGPKIDMKYGRKDADSPACCVDEGNLPAGNAPFPGADTPQVGADGDLLYPFIPD